MLIQTESSLLRRRGTANDPGTVGGPRLRQRNVHLIPSNLATVYSSLLLHRLQAKQAEWLGCFNPALRSRDDSDLRSLGICDLRVKTVVQLHGYSESA